jgi:hypothetical protein
MGTAVCRNDSIEDKMSNKWWWGVDFDATIAKYEGWRPDGGIGEPIERAVKYVKRWMDSGKTVKIMTARANPEGHEQYPEQGAQQAKFIHDWTTEVFGRPLEVTYKKDLHMVALLDDRAVQIYPNTGETLEERIERLEQVIRYLVTLMPHKQDQVNQHAGYQVVPKS